MYKPDTDNAIEPQSQTLQFSKAPILENFGELQAGEIPEPLKYSRDFSKSNNCTELTTISNGIRVCSEAFNSPFAGVGVFVNAGSRNESLNSTGAAFLHERSVLNGTNSRTGSQLSADIAESGGSYDSHTGREVSHHTMKVFSDQVPKAVEILGGIVSNTTVNENALEAEKEIIRDIHEGNHTEHEHITLENAHFNAYREHMMGQPVRGDRDHTSNLTAEDVHNYHANNYYGDNMVVVGTGHHDHNDLVDLVEQHFSNVPKTADAPRANAEKPIYTPALLFIRDDEMYNANVGIFYDAPGVKDEDYWGF